MLELLPQPPSAPAARLVWGSVAPRYVENKAGVMATSLKKTRHSSKSAPRAAVPKK